ncbi:AI-2E family transporter [Humidesulfovibrio sp.]
MTSGSSFGQRLAPFLALASLGLLVSLILAPFLAPLAWAGVLAYASWPMAAWLRKRCGGRETLAATLATALATLTLCGPLLWLLWIGQQEVSRIYPAVLALLHDPPQLPETLRTAPWIGEWLEMQRALLLSDPKGMAEGFQAWLGANAGVAAELVGGVGRNLVKLVLTLMIVFFFYRNGPRIVDELRHVLVRFIGPRANGYLAAAGGTTRAVVYGILLTALAQGIVAGLGYWVAGLGSPVSLGAFTALVALIPFATPLAWGGAGAWLLLQGEPGAAIGVWIWGAAVVSQLDNFLRPLFISSAGTIPFLLVLFGVLGGTYAFGLVGLFTGPIVLAIAWAVWREWVEHLVEADAGTAGQ